MTGFALGPPAADSAEFAAFTELHGVEPRTPADAEFLRHLLWFLQLGGDPARAASAIAEHRLTRAAAAAIERARRGP